MFKPLGFYLSLRISHDFFLKMRPKMVDPQGERGNDLPTSPFGWCWEVIPSLLLEDHHSWSHFPKKNVTYPRDWS